MKKRKDINRTPAPSWLNNFPKKYHTNLQTYHPEPGELPRNDYIDLQKNKRYEAQRTVPSSNDMPTQPSFRNANLEDAARRYALQADRRKGEDRRIHTMPPSDKIVFNQRKTERRKTKPQHITMRNATLRDSNEAELPTNRIGEYSFRIPPIRIEGLEYHVVIGDDVMIIGCVSRKISEWEQLSNQEILTMDGKRALAFWRQHKTMLLSIALEHQEKVLKS